MTKEYNTDRNNCLPKRPFKKSEKVKVNVIGCGGGFPAGGVVTFKFKKITATSRPAGNAGGGY